MLGQKEPSMIYRNYCFISHKTNKQNEMETGKLPNVLFRVLFDKQVACLVPKL